MTAMPFPVSPVIATRTLSVPSLTSASKFCERVNGNEMRVSKSPTRPSQMSMPFVDDWNSILPSTLSFVP